MSGNMSNISTEDLHNICDILGIEKHRYCNKTEMVLKIRYKFSNQDITEHYNFFYNTLNEVIQETLDKVFPQQDNMWDLLAMDIKDCIKRISKQSMDQHIKCADDFYTKASLYVHHEDVTTIDILKILELAAQKDSFERFCDYIDANPEVNFTEIIKQMKRDEQQRFEKKSLKEKDHNKGHEHKHEHKHEKKSFKQHEKKSFKQHNNNGQKQNNDQHKKFSKNKNFNKNKFNNNKFNKNKFNNNKQQ